MSQQYYVPSVLCGLFVLFGAVYYQSLYGTAFTCNLDALKSASLRGKVVVVTGANTGLGYATALQLAQRQARVVMGCRDPEKGRVARERIVKSSGSTTVSVVGIDLSNMKKVHKFVDKIKEIYGKVDVLINNAATGPSPEIVQMTSENLEKVVATNYLGPLHLSTRILPLLSEEGKIITVVCDSVSEQTQVDIKDINNTDSYQADRVYAKSKLLNSMMARMISTNMTRRQTSYTVDPGTAWTRLHAGQPNWFSTWIFWAVGPAFFGATSPVNACATAVWLSAGGAGQSKDRFGGHFKDCTALVDKHPQLQDVDFQESLWKSSVDLISSVLYL